MAATSLGNPSKLFQLNGSSMGTEARVFDGPSCPEAVLNADDIIRWVGEVQGISGPVIEC